MCIRVDPGKRPGESASRRRSSTIRLRSCFITEPTEFRRHQTRPIQAVGDGTLRPLPFEKQATWS
jgi:hypothetical protein